MIFSITTEPLQLLQWRLKFLKQKLGKRKDFITDEELLKLIMIYRNAIEKLLEPDKLNFET